MAKFDIRNWRKLNEDAQAPRTRMTEREKRETLEAVSRFNEYNKNIYKTQEITEMVENIKTLSENASRMVTEETADWFDAVSVKRDTKAIGEATITIALDTDIATTLAHFDGESFVITSPDGDAITYEFGKDGNEGTGTHTTGSLTSGGNTLIQLQGLLTINEIAEEIKNGIIHLNGHGGRVTVNREAAVLSLEFAIGTLNEYLNEGDYFSLDTGTFEGFFEEIMRVREVDEANNKFILKNDANDAKVGINTTAPTLPLQVTGAISAR